MATQKGSGLISRAVREALSTLVSPTMCEQLINRSLASQGLSAVPESGAEIGEWLEGSLRGEVETAVGPDAADLMMMQLGPMAAYAAIAQPAVSIAAAAPQTMASKAPQPAISKAPTMREAPSVQPGPASDPGELDDRPTDLRFDVGAEPVWAPATQPPAKKASTPRASAFRSEPPTGVFSAQQSDAARNGGLFASLRPSQEPQVRTLPPAKRVSDLPPAPSSSPSDAKGLTARPAPLEDDSEDLNKALPMVLTASNNQTALRELRRYLASAASVAHVPDLVGLLDALDEPGVVEPIVLIDCHSPTVHISSVSAIGEDLPRGTTVVLWGVDDTTWQQIDRDRSPACRWVRCSSEATTDDVGSLCSMLLG